MVRQKHRAMFDHEFSVVWSQERTRFEICRDGERTAAFSRNQSTAIGFALREAQQEALLNGDAIIVSSMRDGRRIVEWDGKLVAGAPPRAFLAEYKIRIFTAGMRPRHIIYGAYSNDDEAVMEAQRRAAGRAVEVWSSSTCIYRASADTVHNRQAS
jgi:hypothetical protein